MELYRTRAWRRFRSRLQQKKQTAIFMAVTRISILPTSHDWTKQHALSCGRSNCGFCRNPRFNRNSNGSARLTISEHQANISMSEYMHDLHHPTLEYLDDETSNDE